MIKGQRFSIFLCIFCVWGFRQFLTCIYIPQPLKDIKEQRRKIHRMGSSIFIFSVKNIILMFCLTNLCIVHVWPLPATIHAWSKYGMFQTEWTVHFPGIFVLQVPFAFCILWITVFAIASCFCLNETFPSLVMMASSVKLSQPLTNQTHGCKRSVTDKKVFG